MKTSLSKILRASLSAGVLLAAWLPVSAAPVTSYGAFKTRDHEQTGPVPANPPAVTGHGFYAFAVVSKPDALLLASVVAGAGGPLFLTPEEDHPLSLAGHAQFGTQAELDAALPNGNLVAFQFFASGGATLNASITLAGNAYPAAPALKNFTAGQDIDRTQPFTLQWDKPAQLDAADYVLVEVEANGDPVAGSPAPWEAGALAGTTTSFTIPANSLPAGAELVGRIIFVNVTATEAVDIPGAFGSVGNVAATDFTLKLRGTGGGGGCSNDLTERGDTFIIARFANFLQSSATAPVPSASDEEPVACFFASFFPSATSATRAEVGLPNGQIRTLSPVGGSYLSQKTFADEAALNAEFGPGNYLARVITASGTGSLTVNLGNAPTTPRCANHAAAQAINAAADFALTWDAFTGTGANDLIEIAIHNEQDTVFHRPDDCAVPPKPLAATATSVTIPANTLQAGKTYVVELEFIKISGTGTNASPAFTALGGYSKMTRFNLTTTGGAANLTPVITAARIAGDLRFEADVTASPGRTLTLEATADYAVWTSVGTATVPASGKATVRDSRVATAAFQAYRVRSE